MSHNDPIGILDSGIGGLTIWREIERLLSNESILYIGDHVYQPYSGKSVRVIRQRVKRLITFLLERQAKLIVVACNTATVAGIDVYRRWFPTVPIIGVVPVVKTAVSITKTKHVAVISTPYTASSSYQKWLIQSFANGCTVVNIGVPDLAAIIEQGKTGGREDAILHRYLDPITKKNIDVIALGCTHYPFIKETIQTVVGKGVAVIDSGGAVARHTARILDANKLRAGEGKPYTVFYTTGDAKNVTRIATELIGDPIRFTYVRV